VDRGEEARTKKWDFFFNPFPPDRSESRYIMVGEGRSGRVLEFWPSLCVAFSWVGKKRKQPKAETKKRGGDVAAGPSAPVPLAQPANRRVVGASFPAEAGISSAGFRRG
jgi:hypothetical protein